MNIVVARTRLKYRQEREEACYSVFDIELLLKKLAWNGLIWTLQGMKDLTEVEEVLINHYLIKHRANQVYDNIS